MVYTFIDTVSKSDGRPDGQCGGRGSVTTPPDRGTRVSYTFIYTVSESDGRPDGECGGGRSESTPPDRGPGYEGKLYLYRYTL